MRQGERETGRQGDRETGGQGDRETGRQGERERGREIERRMSDPRVIRRGTKGQARKDPPDYYQSLEFF